MLKGNETAMPEIITDLEANGLQNTYSYGGLTIRQHFAAMAKTPDEIFKGVFDAWKDDNNNVPFFDQRKFELMLKDISSVDAKYKSYLSEALIIELNK